MRVWLIFSIVEFKFDFAQIFLCDSYIYFCKHL